MTLLNNNTLEIKKAEPRDGSGGNKMGGSDPSSTRKNGKPKKRRKSKATEDSKYSYARKASRAITGGDLENFVNLNAVSNALSCHFCPETFTSHAALALHSVDHREDGRYSCHLCDHHETFPNNIERHLKRHDSFGCLKCKRVFKNKLSAYKHSKHHPEEFVRDMRIQTQTDVYEKTSRKEAYE
ncbi:unnamed protein product [Acanthoscelides obtectus]|uniref:C2H2-type domain-containing protein n=1 Tax=Acanthoscelides obtectus TaxID=200917 RepID=A0A9P0PNU0_ACAOB|nr:unnamed protein product [Acanthoscelides obtectus]CAK1643042.1 hypothetical protein AOBTE_LOCUS13388 [Acanthoscelides obtectus]